MVVAIDKAVYLGGYRIKFDFSERVSQTIEAENFLKSAKNSMTKMYLDKNIFQGFRIEYGDIVWNDYEMCFPIWDLHEGKI
ncbi:DUF2442 domain-containing protein [Adhaeribacter arboris]|uniref:DUF2442 domain-containing protein n=1 Tax=Adhaeribacter arboris TaxID=2072846 RepID=A0A2T2YIL0_9BACT|nr:DUF2442 domain-containing protein [Adhaeribacter arboris]PSR55342.1 DUF2442 domain-containing protein [Adhaeribacter arboris]